MTTYNTEQRDFLIEIYNHENEASYFDKYHYPFIKELARVQRHTIIKNRMWKGKCRCDELIFLLDLLKKENENINPGRKCCNGELVCKYFETRYARHNIIMKRIMKLDKLIKNPTYEMCGSTFKSI